jgi:hypothetical protein
MSAQIPDTVLFESQTYDLAGVQGEGLFEPAGQGLPVVMASTICWRGYVCTYAVAGDRLTLEALKAMAGRYEGDDFFPVELPLIHGHAGERIGGRGEMFNAAYHDLGMPVAFTGQLVLGAEMMEELYDEVGTPPPWVYRRVLELRFSAGVLTGREDLSKVMAGVRAERARPSGTA